MNRKEKRAALKSALTDKVNSEKFIVVDKLELDEYKTKKMVEILDNLKVDGKSLIVLADNNEKVVKSAANIEEVQTASVETLNVYDIVNNGTMVVTKDAALKIQEVYA